MPRLITSAMTYYCRSDFFLTSIITHFRPFHPDLLMHRRSNSSYFLIWLLLATCCKPVVLSRKEKLLSPLILLPITGDEPRIGEACRLASEIVFQEVNSRQDILPDYHIEPIYRDEGSGSLQSVRQVADYRQNYILANNKSLAYPSPLMMGPFFSGGCKAMAGHIHHYDMVTLSEGCSAPVPPANRRFYPNLYRSRITGELVAYPKLHFLREVGGWQRFGILTNAGNLFDYTLASHLLKEAERNGFEVSFFDCIPDVDDHTMAMLKQSDTRIIVFDFTVPPLILKFLCQTYRFGMTEGRYSFILFYGSYFEPSAMPSDVAGCTKEQIYEQLQYAFWIAWSSFSSKSTIRSSIGHNLQEFETIFDSLSGNKTKPADYDKRILCYDATISAVTALDIAEKELRSQNMSLSHFRDRSNQVMRIVNASMGNVDFNGLRIGRFQYSKLRAELEYDTFVAVQWTPQLGRVVLDWYELAPNVTTVHNYSSYTAKVLAAPNWFTKDGKPPRDRRQVSLVVLHVYDAFFYAAIALGGAICIIHIVVLFKLKWEGMALGFCFLAIGCFAFVAAAILFAVPLKSLSQIYTAVCFLQRIFISMGFAFAQGGLLSSLFFHHVNFSIKRKYKGYYTEMVLTSTLRQSNKGTSNSHHSRRENVVSPHPQYLPKLGTIAPHEAPLAGELNPDNFKRICCYMVTIAVTVTIFYLVAWLTIDSPNSVFSTMANKAHYDFESDTYSDIKVYACTSQNDAIWAAVLAAIHAIFLATATYLGHELRNCNKEKDSSPSATTLNYANKLEAHRLVAFNFATLFLGGFLLVIVLSSPVDQTIAISAFLLLLSAITGVILLCKGDIFIDFNRCRNGSSFNNGNATFYY